MSASVLLKKHKLTRRGPLIGFDVAKNVEASFAMGVKPVPAARRMRWLVLLRTRGLNLPV